MITLQKKSTIRYPRHVTGIRNFPSKSRIISWSRFSVKMHTMLDLIYIIPITKTFTIQYFQKMSHFKIKWTWSFKKECYMYISFLWIILPIHVWLWWSIPNKSSQYGLGEFIQKTKINSMQEGFTGPRYELGIG